MILNIFIVLLMLKFLKIISWQKYSQLISLCGWNLIILIDQIMTAVIIIKANFFAWKLHLLIGNFIIMMKTWKVQKKFFMILEINMNNFFWLALDKYSLFQNFVFTLNIMGERVHLEKSHLCINHGFNMNSKIKMKILTTE